MNHKDLIIEKLVLYANKTGLTVLLDIANDFSYYDNLISKLPKKAIPLGNRYFKDICNSIAMDAEYLLHCRAYQDPVLEEPPTFFGRIVTYFHDRIVASKLDRACNHLDKIRSGEFIL